MQFIERNDSLHISLTVTLAKISANDISTLVKKAGFERYFLLADSIDDLLAEYQQVQQKIQQNIEDEGFLLDYRIAEIRPAELVFELSPDKMLAFAIITAAWGGPAISANTLVKAAQEAGIVFGFRKENIIKLVSHASQAEPGTKVKLAIAKGRAVIQGLNSQFVAIFRQMESRRNAPQALDDSKADLRDFGAIPAVKAGEPLMRRLPPSFGTDGLTVTGHVVPSTPGVVLEWNLADGVTLDKHDKDLLVATRDGLARVIENGAVVDNVFTLNDVDLETGHIVFKGTVLVNGNVREGMKIIAGGNIIVRGLVEGRLLEAGGDIQIAGAIIGHQIASAEKDTQYSLELKAKGDIECNLAQYAHLTAEGNVYANKQIMHCFVSANKVFAGPEAKPNGKIVGGYFYLDSGVYTGNLGAPSSSNIYIELNRLTDPIVQKQEVLRSSVAIEKQAMLDIREQQEKLKKFEASAALDARKQELQQEFNDHKAIALALIEDIKILEEKRKEKLSKAQIVVHQQLFSAVEIRFDKDIIRTRREYGPSRVQLIKGQAVIDPFY